MVAAALALDSETTATSLAITNGMGRFDDGC
jgi:hypothetical protein